MPLNFHVGKLDYNYNLIKAYREQSANNNVDSVYFLNYVLLVILLKI